MVPYEYCETRDADVLFFSAISQSVCDVSTVIGKGYTYGGYLSCKSEVKVSVVNDHGAKVGLLTIERGQCERLDIRTLLNPNCLAMWGKEAGGRGK
jgi:hypothetical protein